MKKLVVGCVAALPLSLLSFVPSSPRADPQGLVLRIEREGVEADVTVSRLAALAVANGDAPSAFVPPGAFRATFEGQLDVELRDRFTFAFDGVGKVVLELGGKVVLDADHATAQRTASTPTRLAQGLVPFVLRFDSRADGSGALRLLWSAPSFGFEPIPPALLRHTPNAELAASHVLRAGRAAFAEYRCAACHAGAPTDGMAELAATAPRLGGVGSRVDAEWLRAHVLDPQSQRPTTTMPRVLHGETAARDAADVAAYLASLLAPEAERTGPKGDVNAGGIRFAQLGCIACHTLPGGDPDAARVPLAHVARKFLPGALAEFLAAPAARHPWTQMPDFGLDANECADIAAFLVARATAAGDAARAPGATAGATAVGDAKRGREVYSAAGCFACHGPAGDDGDAAASPARKAAPAVADLATGAERGCLADGANARGGAPDFAFAEGLRTALRAFVRGVGARGPASLAHRDVVEAAQRQVAALRCDACHARDGAHAQWSTHADECASFARDFLLPELPHLTYAGEKLHEAWVAGVLQGRPELRARPWLASRMPAFASRAEFVARGLAAGHGLPARDGPSADDVPAAADRIAIGKRLVGPEGGFACNVCHGVADKPPMAVFEAQGVNLAISGRRLRTEWYRRWMLHPQRIDPASKMPRYSDDKGRTGFVETLDGDAVAQFDAILAFMRSLR